MLKLVSDLRSDGIDAVLDQWDLSPGEDIAVFMEQGLKNAKRVVVVCSKNYVERVNTGRGGVGYEKMIVTAELIENLGTKKFIPIIRGSGAPPVPTFLGYRLYIDFEDDANIRAGWKHFFASYSMFLILASFPLAQILLASTGKALLSWGGSHFLLQPIALI